MVQVKLTSLTHVEKTHMARYTTWSTPPLHEWSSPFHVHMDPSLASAGHILLPENAEAFQGWGKPECWN